MGFRFQKRIRIFKGLTLNLSKTGTSLTVGRRGASVNIRGDRVTGNVGIPGTGVSYRKRLDSGAPHDAQSPSQGGQSHVLWWGLMLLALLVIWLLDK